MGPFDGLLSTAATSAAPTGLLGLTPDELSRARSMALLSLAGGMVRGDFGGGLQGAGQMYQGVRDSLVKNKLQNIQAEDTMQQIGLRGVQLRQAEQQWQMLQPIYKALGDAYSSAPGGNAAAPAQSQPSIPSSPGGALGSGTFGIPVGGQSAAQPAQPGQPASQSGSVMGIPMSVAGPILALGGPSELAKTVSSYNTPTDFVKMLRAANIDPSSPIGRQLIQANIAKTNYVAPVNARPGSILRDPFSSQPVAYNPHVPEGTRPVFDEQGNVKEFQPIGNAEPALALASRATTFGKAQATPSIVYGPDGVPRFSTVAQDIQRAGGTSGMPPSPSAQPGMTGNFVGDPTQVAQAISQINDPQERANAQAAFEQQMRATGGALPQGGVTPTLKPGAVTGADKLQSELSQKWTDLSAMNQQAQTTKSYLDSIKQLAGQAAVGPFTDKLQFANSLLGLVGSEKATDAVTANDLLKKYGNQIVSRLGGSGGLSTDAARAILQSAYPNEHMTQAAINEAADNLIGANSMIQSKARLLQQSANSRDPVTYSQKELAFDQNADPRIWQLANMDKASGAAYLSRLPPGVRADLARRMVALQKLGAL